MGVGVPIILDEDPPQAVGRYPEIGFELVLLGPVHVTLHQRDR